MQNFSYTRQLLAFRKAQYRKIQDYILIKLYLGIAELRITPFPNSHFMKNWTLKVNKWLVHRQ
jgi:hypothetical protein